MDRSGFLEWVGPVKGRVLEIGCGTGRNAAWLRSNGATEIVGVEIDSAAAALATERFDVVYSESVESAMPKVSGTFDLILCCDVLEHLLDPWTVVSQLRGLSEPTSILAVSIPNVRHYRVLWDIAFGRGFDYPLDGTYDPHSIFDTTHLRFFTKGNVDRMLRNAGWTPDRWGVPPRRRLVRARAAVDTLTRGSANDWLSYQWYVVARPEEASSKDRG